MSLVTLGPGVTLSYSDRGSIGDPTVLLLPGPTDSWRSFAPIVTLLPEGLRVVAVSLRGHGDSSKLPTGYAIEDLAVDVVPLLDELHIERVVLAGHSGSCFVARRVAIDAPERVRGLLLEASPTTLRESAQLIEFVSAVVSELTDPIDREFARSFIADTSTDSLDPNLVERLVDDLVKVPVVVWKELFGSLLDYDDTAELATVTAPSLLVWGDADSLVSRSMQDQLLRLLPRAELTVYQGVGHTPRWEQSERFASDVAAFTRHALQ
jgi:non-heme chloroperoxidase